MKSENEIREQLKKEKEEMDNLLRLSMKETDSVFKNAHIAVRSKVYERVVTLEWILGVRKSIEDLNNDQVSQQDEQVVCISKCITCGTEFISIGKQGYCNKHGWVD